jgi:hypothetical protein
MATMKGVWVDGKTQTLKDFPIPEPQEGQVLIKVACAAQNPKDWKGTYPLPPPNSDIDSQSLNLSALQQIFKAVMFPGRSRKLALVSRAYFPPLRERCLYKISSRREIE